MSMTVLKKLSHRHHRVALLAASGMKSPEIAADIGMHPNSVRKYLCDPQIQVLIEGFKKQFVERCASTLEQQMIADGPNTFKRLTELRDQTRNPKVSLGACGILFDRQAPKKTMHQEDRVIRFEFSKDDKARIGQVLDEADVVDVSPHADPA